ncbi:fumarylacetoacetate hydrolase family protein [Chloroflexia bacterium SDU3-3]|nr:fumarylacetoacetate hydrolase family protein [Chloroflexia bacterium SDU3-3]
MRFLTFSYLSPRPRVGVQLGGAVIDLSAAAPLVFEHLERPHWTLLDILQGQPDGMGVDGAAEIAAAVLDQLGIYGADALQEAPDLVEDMSSGPLSIGGAEMVLPLDEVRLLAPLPRLGTLRLFNVFEEHALAAASLRHGGLLPEWYEQPLFAFGNPNAILGPAEELDMPQTAALDYALGVACVIGRAGRDIGEDEAEQHIAGYMVMNGWCARDLERLELAAGYGPSKSRDFASSLGPVLATPDEIEERLLPDGRYNLAMVARVNGQEVSRGNMRDASFTFAQMIASASRDATLYPGDVLFSGAVGGGSLLEQTEGRGPWLERGDEVELEIGGLGALRTPIR